MYDQLQPFTTNILKCKNQFPYNSNVFATINIIYDLDFNKTNNRLNNTLRVQTSTHYEN